MLLKWFVMDEEEEEAGSQARQAFVQFRVVGYTELDPIWNKRGLTSPFTITRTWANNIASTE